MDFDSFIEKKAFFLKLIFMFLFVIIIAYNSVYDLWDLLAIIGIMVFLSFMSLIGYKYLLDFL